MAADKSGIVSLVRKSDGSTRDEVSLARFLDAAQKGAIDGVNNVITINDTRYNLSSIKYDFSQAAPSSGQTF